MLEHLWACLMQQDSCLSWVIHTDRSTWMKRPQNDKLVFLVSEAKSTTQPCGLEKRRVSCLQAAFPDRLSFTRANKTKQNKNLVKQQTTLLVSLYFININAVMTFSSPKRTKYRIENCLEVYLSWLGMSSFLFSFPYRSPNVNIIPGQLYSGTEVSLS